MQLCVAMSQASGNLFVISAPSGAGKTSLVAALCERMTGVVVCVSYTTRPRREREIDGQHYHFVSHERFAEMLDKQAFVEYAEVFGNYYGTARASVESVLAEGTDVILEIDWQGAAQIRKTTQSVGIFILPPSIESLSARLTGRGQDDPKIINRRMAAAAAEMTHYAEFDFLVINDDFEQAFADLQSIILASRLRRERQQRRFSSLISTLLEGTRHE